MTRQRNIFAATMENFGNVVKYTGESMNSAGVAEEKYGVVLDSIEATINKLIATWEQFITNLNQSGTFKGAIEMVAGFVKVLDVLINNFKALQIIAPPLVFTFLTSQGIKMYKNLKNISEAFQKSTEALKTDTIASNANVTARKGNVLSINIENTARKSSTIATTTDTVSKKASTIAINTDTVAKNTNTTATNIATVATNAFKTATNGLSVAIKKNPLLFWVGVVTTAVSIIWSLVEALIPVKQSVEEITSNFKQNTKTINANITSIKSIEKEYNSLSRIIDENGKVIGGSAEQQARYHEIANQIADMFPEMVAGYDEENNAILKKNASLDEMIEKLERELELENLKIVKDKDTLFKNTKTKIKDTDKKEEKRKDDLYWNEQNLESAENEVERLQQLYQDVEDGSYDAMNGINRDSESIATQLSNITQALESETARYKTLSNERNQLLKEEALYNSEIEKANKGLFSTLGKSFLEIQDAYKEMDISTKSLVTDMGALLNASDFENADSYTSALSDIVTKVNQLDEAQKMSLIWFKQTEKSFKEGKISIADYQKAYADLVQKMGGEQKVIEFGIKINFKDIDSMVSELVGRFKGVTESQLRSLSLEDLEIVYSMENVGAMSFDTMKQKIEDIKGSSDDLSTILDNVSSSFSDVLGNFATSVQGFQSNFDTLSLAIEEFNTYGGITANTLKTLTENNLLEFLSMTEQGLVFNTNAFYNNTQAMVDNAKNQAVLTAMKQVEALVNGEVIQSQEDATQATINENEILNMIKRDGFASYIQGATNATVATDALIAKMQEAGIVFQRTPSAYSSGIREIVGNLQSNLKIIDKVSSATNNYTRATQNAGSAAKSTADAIKEKTEALKDEQEALEDYIDLVVKMIKQEYKERKEALQDLKDTEKEKYDTIKDNLDEIERIQKEKYEDERDRLNDAKDDISNYYDEIERQMDREADAYNDKIEAQKKILSLQEEERKYQNELANKVKDVAKIQSELAKLQFDDSIEGQKKKLELLEQLGEKESDLNEFQQEHNVDIAEDALDAELDRYNKNHESKMQAIEDQKRAELDAIEESIKAQERKQKEWENLHEEKKRQEEEANKKALADIDEQIKAVEKQAEQEGTLRIEAMRRIKEEGDKTYQDLIEWNRKYGDGLDATITTAWEKAKAVVKKYNGEVIGIQAVLETLSKKMAELASETEKAANSAGKLAGGYRNATNEVDELIQALRNAQKAEYDLRKSISETERESREEALSVGTGNTDKQTTYLNLSKQYKNATSQKLKDDIAKRIKALGYQVPKNHDGTNSVEASSYDKEISKLLGLDSDEVFRVLKTGEAVVPAEKNPFNPDLLNNPSVSNTPITGDSVSSVSVSIGDIVVQGNADDNTISKLDSVRKGIVNDVFAKLNKHTTLGGFKNIKNYV